MGGRVFPVILVMLRRDLAAVSATALAAMVAPAAASASTPAAASLPAPAIISPCFAPEQDCAAVVIAAIEGARHQILVNAYNLTTGAGIVEALVRARARGIDVRLIADKRTPCERNSGLDALAAAGAPIWIDRAVPIAHAKVMVIDARLTLMGSYNWTRSAARNSEDLNLVTSRRVAAAYAAQWAARAQLSVPFAARGDWCRPRRSARLDREPDQPRIGSEPTRSGAPLIRPRQD
jgi:phosphatidylserine/phosphatidylglycerophosphate/cardiolipin synthase-like enzyme